MPLKISIVTPCFNHAGFLEQTLLSIHSQGYPNLQHIVVNGGSTDGSVEIIRRYANRLCWWCSEPDRGHGDALAKGFLHAGGDIVTWICSDDILLPGALHHVANYFTDHPGEDWVAGDGLKIDAESRVLRVIYGMRLTHSGLVNWTFAGAVQPAIFIRGDAFRQVGGVGEALNLCPDFDLALRLARRRRSGYLSAFLGGLRIHENTQTIRRNVELQCVASSLRERESRERAATVGDWAGGRWAPVRYGVKRLARLAVNPLAPIPYRVGKKLTEDTIYGDGPAADGR